MRRLITLIVRATELPPWLLVLISLFGVTLAFIERELVVFFPDAPTRAFGILGYLFALLPLVPVATRDFNVWRLFPPRYHGINRALERIALKFAKRECIYIGADQRIRIDAHAALRECEPLLRNLSFVGADRSLQRISGEINALAFSGTRYGLSSENKATRNAGIAVSHPASFALLKNGEGGYCGLSATIPIPDDVLTRYSLGRISDNDFSGALVSRPGEPVGAVVFFLIAHCREAGRSRESLLPHTLGFLVETCLLQLILIAIASPGQRQLFALAANSDPKMKDLFTRLHLVPRPDYDSADQEDVFGNWVYLRKVDEAKAHLVQAYPDLAEMLGLRISQKAAA